MKRKLIYVFSLVGFFLMWGAFGFVAGTPRSGSAFQETMPPRVSPSAPLATDAAGVPVTGEPEPGLTEILVFYGLIGFTALFLTLALLKLASKSATSHSRHEAGAPHETNHE